MGLMNKEKYSMKIGNETETITSVVPSTTDLLITFSGSLGFLSGSSKMDIAFEDIKVIHVNLIEMGHRI